MNRIFARIGFAVLLVSWALPGCGGGTMGTGVRTLGRDIPRDDTKSPLIAWPSFSGDTCSFILPSGTAVVMIESAFGDSPAVNSSRIGCGFEISSDVRSLKLHSDWLKQATSIGYDLELRSCEAQGSEIVGAGKVSSYDGTIEISRKRWQAPHGKYFLLRLRAGSSEELTVPLIIAGDQVCG